MGAAYYLVFAEDFDGSDYYVDGKAMARHANELDGLADELGLLPLSDFFNESALMEEVTDLMDLEAEDGDAAADDEEADDEDEGDFYEPSEILTTVEGLITALEAGKPIEEKPAVLEDLRGFRTLLQKAAEEGIGASVMVDY